jgi:hypothetical protein
MRKTFALAAIAAASLLSACADHSVSGITGPQATSVGRSAASSNSNSGLTLHPEGFGPNSFAAWRAHEGLPDSRGNADMALYFQKMTTTPTYAAGVARIKGLEGQPLSAITGLSWEHRIDGWCGAGAPRWDIIVSDQAGNRGVIFLGCAAAAHSPGTDPTKWIRDSYPAGTAIADRVRRRNRHSAESGLRLPR